MNRQLKSMCNYADGLFDMYSKLLVLRVDLSYSQERASEVEVSDLKSDVKRLLGNRHYKPSIFNPMVGYIIKFEHGDTKGPHCHAIFFYDGNMVKHDGHIADLIGTYWSKVITSGEGLYFNCNRHKHHYQDVGIGMIAYWDEAMRRALHRNVIGYLAKSDQSIASAGDKKVLRGFTRGVLPVRKSAAGRPRLYQSEEIRV